MKTNLVKIIKSFRCLQIGAIKTHKYDIESTQAEETGVILTDVKKILSKTDKMISRTITPSA